MKIFKIISFNFNIKNWIKNFQNKLIEFFLFENSIKILSNAMKNFYIISIGFDEIYNEIKNSRRFILCIILNLIMWFALSWHLLLLTPQIWSMVNNEFLPDYLHTSIFIISAVLVLAAVEKIDYLLAQTNAYIHIFNVFYNLSHKTSHQLSDQNYKKLALYSQIVITKERIYMH